MCVYIYIYIYVKNIADLCFGAETSSRRPFRDGCGLLLRRQNTKHLRVCAHGARTAYEFMICPDSRLKLPES